MHRIDCPTATPDNRFTEGDPTIPVAATTVTADWLNAVQEELVAVIADAGLPLAKEETNQLLQALGEIISVRAPQLNDEEWILVSGTWTAPAATWYEITVWHGGGGGWWSTTLNRGGGGMAVAPKTYLAHYEEGEEVPVTIAAGGIGTASSALYPPEATGGVTEFGDLPTEHDRNALIIRAPYLHGGLTASTATYISGAGPGGGSGDNAEAKPAYFYGAGGAVCYTTDQPPSVSDGYHGAVRIRRHNPAKAHGPLPEPALLSVAKSRAAAGASVVTLYDPATGRGSIWRAEDAEAKLAAGMVSKETWLEVCAQNSAQEYAQWLADPATESERFELLRAAREARLAATDYLAAGDYPLADDARAEITAYRQALRDLPAEAGAPWDGGGEATPWPEEPAVGNVEEDN